MGIYFEFSAKLQKIGMAKKKKNLRELVPTSNGIRSFRLSEGLAYPAQNDL